MTPESHLVDISRVIQLAIAPVFLLTAIGTLINVLAGRLARAVDRSRVLEERFAALEPAARQSAGLELQSLSRRVRLVYVAISLAVLSAVFLCLLIVGAFADAFVPVDLARFVALMFVLSMVSLTGSLLVFLREIFFAVTAARRAIAEPTEVHKAL